jgi:hypothetical protein
VEFVQRIDNSFIPSLLSSSPQFSLRTLDAIFAVVGAAQSLQPVHGAVVVETETLVIVAVEVFTTVAVDTAVEVSVAVTVSVA